MVKKCVLCNKIYQTCHSPQRFCSYRCAAIWGAQKRPKRSIIKKCLHCNKEFKVAFSGIKMGKGKFCSNTCSGLHRRTGIKGFCKTCNKPIIIRRDRIFYKEGNFCSIKCKGVEHSKYYSGEKHYNWKGGRYINRGYVFILNSDHPHCNKMGYIQEHRFIIEKQIGRYLKPYEFIHHINKIKTDNRIENLQLVTKKTHYGKVTCPHCLKEFLIK